MSDRHYERAELLLAHGRLEDAEHELRAGLALDPDHSELYVELASCLIDMGRLDEAQAAIDRALALAPEDAFAHFVHHELLDQQGDQDGAERAIREALELDPEHADYHGALSMLLLQAERWGPAVVAAEEALALEPDHREALITRVLAQVQLGDAAGAVADARRRLARDPGDAAGYALLGLTDLATGDHRAAFDNFSEAQRIDPTQEWVRDFGLIGLGLTGRPLYSAMIARLLTLPRWSGTVPSWPVALLGPLGLLVVLARVLVGPVSTVVLRCSRYGRLAVGRDDAVAANRFVALSAAVVIVPGVAAAIGGPLVAGAALLVGLYGLVLVGVALGHDPWERPATVAQVAARLAAGLALWALGTAAVLLGLR